MDSRDDYRLVMTERLYYRDPTVLEFDATVLSQTERDGKWHTVLDRSAFYPTSGGQSHDTGTLNGVRVDEVIESDDNRVVHISAQPVAAEGEKVHGVVDRGRRLRHRQLHTAQHILSQVFVRFCGYNTVSVHLGEEYGAVELDTGLIEQSQLVAAEQAAQEVIESGLPVDILFVDSAEAEHLPLRRPPRRRGTIRVIRIGDFDWSACGGTHCTNTSEVGLLKICAVDRIRGHSLVKFLAGRQAWNDYRIRFDVTSRLTRHFTCHVSHLPEKLEKLAVEVRGLQEKLAKLQLEALPRKVDEIVAQASNCGRFQLCIAQLDISDERVAVRLAARVAERIRGVAVMHVSGRLLLAVAEGSGLDAGELTRRFCKACGLKGGGGKTLGQIGGVSENLIPRCREIIAELLRDV